MSGSIEITTERLILRHPVMDDAETITRAKQDVWPELQRWMSWSADGQQTIEATKDFINGPIGKNSLIGFCRHSGAFILMTGLTPQVAPDEYETGYWVARDFLGRGYATEGTCAAIRFAFEGLQAKTIHISHFEGNMKSRRIIQKLGFTDEVVQEKVRACFIDGAMQDSHCFTMTDPAVLPAIEYSWRGRW